jgi:hypothetical protein
VLRVFARLNTYTEPLKGLELLSSQYFGAFKRTVFDIALAHNTFWSRNKIISDQKIARMADAEFTSELVICMLDGIKQTKLPDIRGYYKNFDEAFPKAEQIREQFAAVIDIIGAAYREELPSSQFRRVPLFFSLFLVIYDAIYGMPNTPVPHGKIAVHERSLRTRLLAAEQNFDALRLPDGGVGLRELSSRATADAARRRDRHRILFAALFG